MSRILGDEPSLRPLTELVDELNFAAKRVPLGEAVSSYNLIREIVHFLETGSPRPRGDLAHWMHPDTEIAMSAAERRARDEQSQGRRVTPDLPSNLAGEEGAGR